MVWVCASVCSRDEIEPPNRFPQNLPKPYAQTPLFGIIHFPYLRRLNKIARFKAMTENSAPKKWKFALLVWLFIFPALSLLSITLFPLLVDFPGPLRNLIVSGILVPSMVWFYIPFISKRFFNWLRK